MEIRQKTDPNQRALILTFLAAAAATCFCGVQLLRIPSDSKNAFFLGLSKERLLMAAVFALILVLELISIAISPKISHRISGNRLLKPLCCFLTVVSLFFVLLPDYRFGKASAYFIRISPFVLWLFLTSGLFLLYFCYTADRFAGIRETLGNLLSEKRFILPVLAVLLAGVIFVELTGLGKTVEASLWNKNGIPLQSIQLFLSAVIFSLVWKTGIFTRDFRGKRLIHFLLIWAISALVWSRAPMIPHFFAPGPYAPEQQFFPYSDAITYDRAAQTALNGWEFNFGGTVLKPTVVFISFLTQLITGGDYNRSMLVQSALYGILPAIIYLFGSAVGGTGCGFLAAAFSVMKEWNALASRSVLTVNSRLVMSEFLTQIIFSLFCYALFRWLRKEGNENLYAIITGGTLSLGIFTRYNYFAMFPAAIIILLIAYRKQMRSLIKPLLFFFLAAFMTASPMIYRDSQKNFVLVRELIHTVRDVLIKQRFKGESPFAPDESDPEAIVLPQESGISGTSSVSDLPQDFPETEKDQFNTGQITQISQNINSTKNLPVIPSMINHGLHNFISSALTLPMTLKFHDLKNLYSQDSDGIWSDSWQGDFTAGQWIFIAVWILLGAVSIGMILRLYGIAGFSIPYFWLVYSFSIGFSRSSGGRYIVPTNWIPMLLLSFVCTLILSKGKIPSPAERYAEKIPVWKPVLALAGFTAFFTVMVLFEAFMPARVTSGDRTDLEILQERLADHPEIDWDLVAAQQEEGILHIYHGAAIYPRYYYFLGGEHASNGALMRKDFSRMTFFGINRDENRKFSREFLMPHTGIIESFPHQSVFRAISCRSEFGYEDVLAVTVETQDGEIFTYVRDPLPEFSCPVPEPVCVAIENCY